MLATVTLRISNIPDDPVALPVGTASGSHAPALSGEDANSQPANQTRIAQHAPLQGSFSLSWAQNGTHDNFAGSNKPQVLEAFSATWGFSYRQRKNRNNTSRKLSWAPFCAQREGLKSEWEKEGYRPPTSDGNGYVTLSGTKRRCWRPREADAFALLARGRNRKHISEELMVSEETVKSHASSIYHKLGVHTQQELLDLAEARAATLRGGNQETPFA